MLFFGWDNVIYLEWFVVVDMLQVLFGFEKVYIFNVMKILFFNISLVV